MHSSSSTTTNASRIGRHLKSRPASNEALLVPQLAPLVDPAKTALLIVDVQNDYCHPDGALGKLGAPTAGAMAMIPTLQTLIDAARAFGTKVIFVQTVHTEETDSAPWVRRTGGD